MHGSVWLNLDGTFQPLKFKDPFCPSEVGVLMNISCLMWQRTRLFFLADPDGSGNLWSTNLKGEDLQKHTGHEVFDVRYAKNDQDMIVYTVAGQLWCFSTDTAESYPLSISLGHPNCHLPRSLPAAEWAEEVALHPKGHLISCLCRGSVYEMPLWEGPVMRLPKEVCSCVAFCYLCCGRVLTVADSNLPNWTLAIHPAYPMLHCEETGKIGDVLRDLTDIVLPTQSFILPDMRGQLSSITASPVHDAVLITTSRNELWLVEFCTDDGDRPSAERPFARTDTILHLESSQLDLSEWEDGISDPSWSPDGEWVAYCRKDLQHGSSLILLELKSRVKTVVADSTFMNFSPSFDPDGSYLAFLSTRSFAPVEDDVTCNLSFAHGADVPFLVLLQKGCRNPFLRLAQSQSQLDGDGEAESSCSGESEAEEMSKVKEVLVDLEGIENRLLKFPVKTGRYKKCAWTSGGKFLYMRESPRPSCPHEVGADDDDDEKEDHNFFLSFDFRNLKEEKLWEDVSDFSLSLKLEDMVVCKCGDDPEYMVASAGKGATEMQDDASEASSTIGPESGTLDLSRIMLQVAFADEKVQTFTAIKEFVKECLFDPECGGLDWDGLCESYSKVLPRIGSWTELTDLCTEMLAELGLSHVSLDTSKEEFAESRSGSANDLRTMGVAECSWRDFTTFGAYEVEKLIEGDRWDPQSSGPVARPGVGMTVGTLILAINRIQVCKSKPLEQLLAESNSSEVFVTFVPAENVQSFLSIQEALKEHGGVEGFHNAWSRFNQTDPSRSKKGKKDKKGKKHQRKGAKEEETERKLAAMFKKMHIENVSVWRTVRVATADENTRKNAIMRDLVEMNGRVVSEATNGRVGYILVPDTVRLGFVEFYRHLDDQCLLWPRPSHRYVLHAKALHHSDDCKICNIYTSVHHCIRWSNKVHIKWSNRVQIRKAIVTTLLK